MKLIKQYYLIYTFLCILSLTELSGQTTGYADSVYKSANYSEACIAYEWLVYSVLDNRVKAYSLLQKARCYKHLQSYEKAVNTLSRVSYYHLNDSLDYLIRYEAALNYYLLGNFTEANAQLEQIKLHVKDTTLLNQSLILQIFIDNQLHTFDKAKQDILHYLSTIELDSIEYIDAISEANILYSKKKLPKLKNEKTAQWLSVFIPGSGQIYAGYPLEGSINLLLHLATLAFAAEEFYNGFYITAYLGGLGLFQKFYFGSFKRAAYLANKHNYEKTQDFCMSVKTTLFNYTTKNPQADFMP